VHCHADLPAVTYPWVTAGLFMTPANDNNQPAAAMQQSRRLNVLRCVGWCPSIILPQRVSSTDVAMQHVSIPVIAILLQVASVTNTRDNDQ